MSRIIIFLLFCFWCEEVSLKNLDIRYLTNNDGLSNSSVNCIFQDSSDLLWFGTWDGLNMYNSRGFTVFKPDPSLQNTISNNIIRNIIEEAPGVLWIATDNGINRYQKSKRRFDNYFFLQTSQTVFKENSFHIAKNSKNRIFATYEAVLYYFDENENRFIPLDIKNMEEVRSLFFDVDDNLWIYTGSKELHQIKLSCVNGNFLQEGITHIVATNINAAFYNPFQNKIYIQKENRKILVVDAKDNSIASCGFEIKDVIYSMLFNDRNCYIGTANKLIETDLHTNQETTLLSNHSVLSIYKDKQNILWVGTDARGLVMLTEPKKVFFSFTSRNVQDFGSAPVRSFFDDDKGRLWIGTKGDGLYVVNENEQEATIANKFNIQNGLLSNSVYVLTGNNKIVWIGTEGNGLNYFDFKLNKLGKLQLADDMNLTSVYAIHIQNDSVLWVGTSGYGLYRLTIRKSLNNYQVASYKQFVYQKNNPNSLSNNVIYSILPDGENELWIGTRGGGLNKLNYITETFKNYKFSVEDTNSISSDDILSLFKDEQNNLWIGTSMGLNQMITGQDEKVIFKRYTEKEGISNNTIHGILGDKQGDIWFSTNKGLSRFNVAQNKIVTYYQNNDLQNDEFSDGAYYAPASNQYFYFGGISGYNKFDPLKMLENTYMPSLYLDNFSINNVTVNLDDYSKQINDKKHITLGYKDKIFSFTFIPLDYIDGAKCDLEYQLKDHTNEWIKLRSSRTIVFANVPAGNYTFNVRWSNAENEWNQQMYTLYVTILPPWWLSRYAFLTYVIIAFAMAYFFYRLFKNRMIMKHKLELQTLENQKSEEIHQAKLRFFTNIAHEFCNSLTLIYGPCEQLLQHENKPVAYRKYLNTIKTNAERMQGLIQQLMEFRRVETGYLEVDIEKVDIPELIKYTSDYFVEIAQQKRITFNVNISSNVTYWTSDRDFLEKIIFNLLSNAFKYTPEEGSATLDATIENDHLKITITNTGSGIKLEDQQSIFDRFTILDRFESQILQGLETRTGIGLAVCKDLIDLLHGIISVKSQPKEYASFEVLLPVLDVSFQHKEQHKEQQLLPYDDIVERLPVEKVRNNELNVPAPSQKQTVLVVDDESDICDLLSDILQNQYHVLKAESGEKAFEILEEQLPDVIICDIIMPGMNGIDVVRKLKLQEVTAHIPIIFLTSELSVESQIISIETGVDTYVTKPFQARFLLAAIHQLLNRKQQLKEYYDSPVSSVEKMDGKLILKADKEFILKLTRMVSDNIENEYLSLDILTKEMGISKIQLYRKLKEIRNQTPTEFIRNIRLSHAEKLLRTTDKTVQEIMYACGFNNKAYFYREFAKQYKQTPKEYRTTSNKK